MCKNRGSTDHILQPEMSNKGDPFDDMDQTEPGNDNVGYTGSDEAQAVSSSPGTESAPSSSQDVDGAVKKKKKKKKKKHKHKNGDIELKEADQKPSASNGMASGSNGGKDEDEKWLEWIKGEFIRIAGEDKVIDRNEFRKALKVKKVRTIYRRM